MPCYTPPDYDESVYIDALCKACRMLTNDELSRATIRPHNLPSLSLYDWYKDHVAKDITHNTGKERERAIAEMYRLKMGI